MECPFYFDTEKGDVLIPQAGDEVIKRNTNNLLFMK